MASKQSHCAELSGAKIPGEEAEGSSARLCVLPALQGHAGCASCPAEWMALISSPFVINAGLRTGDGRGRVPGKP